MSINRIGVKQALTVFLNTKACNSYVMSKQDETLSTLYMFAIRLANKEKQVQNFLKSKKYTVNLEHLSAAVSSLGISLKGDPSKMLLDAETLSKKIQKKILILQISTMVFLYGGYMYAVWGVKLSFLQIGMLGLVFGFFVGHSLSLIFRKLEADYIYWKIEKYISDYSAKKFYLRKVQ
jgi:hypothetical protein